MDISEYYPSLAVFAFLTFLSSINGLAKVFGEPSANYVYGYINCKKWSFINDTNYTCYGRFFRVIYYILLLMPIITAGVWVGVIFYLRRNDTYVGPISILLVSLSAVCAILGQRLIVWKRYRLTYTSIVLVGCSVVLIVAYQLLANFYYSLDRSFFGISAIFLSYNCIIIIILIYLNIAKHFITFKDILLKYVKESVEGFIPHSKYKDIAQCIEEDQLDDKYALTIPEYKSFITVTSASTSIGTTGLENMFGSLPYAQQMIINIILYMASLGILAAYSIIAYDSEHEKLGLTVSIAVVATDIMLFALYHSNVIGTILGASMMAIVFRGCLFGFGGKYWYFGCCLLYALAGVKVAFEKVRQQFPFVETKRRSLKVPISNKGSGTTYKMDIFHEPIAAWLFCTALFAILTIILAFTEPAGVALPSLYLGDSDAPFWLMAIIAFLLSLFCYFIIATIRLAVLKSMKYIPRIFKYFLNEGVNEFWIYLAMAYIVVVSTSLILFYFVRNDLLIIYSAFCPLIGVISLYCAMIYAQNNYAVLYIYQMEYQKELIRKKKHAATKANTRRSNRNVFEHEHLSDVSEEEPDEQNNPSDDWRPKTNVAAAFLTGMLHSRDYKIIFSLSLSIILTFFLGFTIQMLGDDSPFPEAWFGVTSSIMIICFLFIAGSLLKHISNGARMTIAEIVILVIGSAVYIAYGIAFYQGREKGDIDINYNMYTLLLYAAIFPAVVTGLMGCYSRFARAEITKVCLILWGLTIVSLGILVGYVYFVFGAKEGTITLGIIVFLVVGIVLTAVISYLSYKGRVIAIIIVVLIACAVMIYDFCEDRMDDFLGFSISYLLVTGGVFVATGYSVFMSIFDWKTCPVIFSSLIFPAFKYKPMLGYPIPYYGKIYIMYICIGAFILWTTLLSIYVTPMYYGVSAGIFAIILALVMSVYFSTYSSYNLKLWADCITEKTINSAWLIAKSRYIQRQGVTTLQELQTFQQSLDSKKRLIASDSDMSKKYIESDVPELKDHDYHRLSYRKKLIWLHYTDKRIYDLYQNELIFLILFEMLTLMSAQSSTNKEQSELVRFVRTRKAELKKHGIKIGLTRITDLDLRYYWILSQKQNMTPEQQVAFNQELAKYQEERIRKDLMNRQIELITNRKQDLKFEIEHDADSIKNITKYKEIIESYKLHGNKYTDSEFPCSNDSLGPVLGRQVLAWKRATDEPSAKIFVDEISPMDLIQGALGDCYLLSAISVMGEKNLRLCIKSTEDNAKSGAFLLKLFRGGEYEEHLIIDDYFPLSHDRSWLFAQCDTIGNQKTLEMWPMILEKAYAKLYKSYERIEGGKVHIALAELTGGIPQYVKITDSTRDNIEEFWEKLFTYNDNGYMLGAGTPENVRGDSAVNENGIVQGHAYAIMDAVNHAGEKLIKLRNPHGSRGIEWNGDWSDESPMWTPATAEALGLAAAADGVFWMSVNDFIEEFKYMYICRKFDKRWTMISIDDYCTGEFTLKDDGFECFPQYEVYVTKPTTIFLKMMQSEKESSFQGKYPIFTVILANDGKKAYKNNTTNMVSSSLPPINYVSVTAELFADALYAYPYTFTVVAGINSSTSGFTLNFYSTDSAIEVRKVN